MKNAQYFISARPKKEKLGKENSAVMIEITEEQFEALRHYNSVLLNSYLDYKKKDAKTTHEEFKKISDRTDRILNIIQKDEPVKRIKLNNYTIRNCCLNLSDKKLIRVLVDIIMMVDLNEFQITYEKTLIAEGKEL